MAAGRYWRLPGDTGGCKEKFEIARRGYNFPERLEAARRGLRLPGEAVTSRRDWRQSRETTEDVRGGCTETARKARRQTRSESKKIKRI
jgi:hypothetical protein